MENTIEQSNASQETVPYDYWKERCLAAENVFKCSTLVRPLGSKNGSYQPEWYEAREKWQKLQSLEKINQN